MILFADMCTIREVVMFVTLDWVMVAFGGIYVCTIKVYCVATFLNFQPFSPFCKKLPTKSDCAKS